MFASQEQNETKWKDKKNEKVGLSAQHKEAGVCFDP